VPTYHLVFDGGSRGNPGPSYGSYRLGLSRERLEPPRRLEFGRGTNNEAEYLTLIAALRELHDRLQQDGEDPSRSRAVVYGDSQLVLSQLEGEWKAKNPRMRRLRDEALELLSPFGGVRLVHQPRWRSVRMLGH
jgi:ribonuclease HI